MADSDAPLNCTGEAADDTRRGLRIGAIFIIMFASLLGALAPVLLARQTRMHVPKFTFFVCKYVGTGVIIATAWMHLLDPAIDNFSDPCVAARVPDYPWALAIGLMTVMTMFLVELVVTSFQKDDDHAAAHGSDSEGPSMDYIAKKRPGVTESTDCPHAPDLEQAAGINPKSIPGRPDDVSYPPGGEDHLAHAQSHKEDETGLAGQLTAIFVLEFGVIFHSIFVGLTLGTTEELVVLLIVLVFHQMFEGLGLGSRIATAPWPKDKKWLPYLLCVGFAISTPVGIAAGMGAKPANATDQKLTNGIFDSISAGILMYTGLVELLAHEFMFNPHMRRSPLKIQLFGFGCIAFGAFIMALLANWA
ncbi:membrane zinc transporter [Cordyceps fumosorosea ARSEF 2679]|uniref:Membrane zinc transporter n=1 Tax=Cordyceps fumosorosea (strain ARSEF 2679) TaxID=1081104 RepID=A0A168ESF2_CORFA|nr:membrane zinc transporter [Cordyceps fumosorosea ARSEF 2679]OAA74156.1 membrane zinc transporter [Cordyceps fumosorosea ARSEF 2679]